MLERLIEITNSEWFLQEGHIASLADFETPMCMA